MSMRSRSRLTAYLCLALIVIGIGSGAWYLAVVGAIFFVLRMFGGVGYREIPALKAAQPGAIRVETVRTLWAKSMVRTYKRAGWTVEDKSPTSPVGRHPRVRITFRKA